VGKCGRGPVGCLGKGAPERGGKSLRYRGGEGYSEIPQEREDGGVFHSGREVSKEKKKKKYYKGKKRSETGE